MAKWTVRSPNGVNGPVVRAVVGTLRAPGKLCFQLRMEVKAVQESFSEERNAASFRRVLYRVMEQVGGFIEIKIPETSTRFQWIAK